MPNFSEFVCYDESSPTKLRWIIDIWVGKNKNRKAISKGDIAGCLNKTLGYYQVRIQRKTYKNHRVIVNLFNQRIEEGLVVDHIDGDKLNNSICNLRIVTLESNAKNRVARKSNTGIPYIHRSEDHSRYQVALVLNGKRHTETFNFIGLGSETIAKTNAIDYLLSKRESMLESGYTTRQIENIMKGLND